MSHSYRTQARLPSRLFSFGLATRTTLTRPDLYTAGTVILAALLTPNLWEAIPPNHPPLENSWKQCIESLSMYAQSESTFAKKCVRVLKAVHAHGSNQTSLQPQTNRKLPPQTSIVHARLLSSPGEHQYQFQGEAGQQPAAPESQPPPPPFQRYGPPAFPWPGHGAGGGADAMPHAGDEFLDSWWGSGSLDWLNNLPDNFDQQGPLDGHLQR